MDEERPTESPTLHAHKRQLAWQILVPILVVAALMIAVGVLTATGAASTNRTWADVSTIWLITPMLIVTLAFVAVLGFLIYGIARLMQVMPDYTGKAQDFFAMLSRWARMIADGAAKPFVWFHQAGAILKSIFKL